MASEHKPGRTAFRYAILAVVISLVGYLAAPLIESALFVGRLVVEAPPTWLPVPVQGVAPHALRDTWGVPRGRDRRHEGIDIFAKRGTPILSATRGLIWRIGTNELGGTVVWVLGPGGDRHYYAHLDRVGDIVEKQRVPSGTVIGYVGNSGNAAGTPPHLHYGIYRRGLGAINPYPLLRSMAAPEAVASGEPRQRDQRRIAHRAGAKS